MNVKSCIYEGTIRHRRFEPVEREFCYRMFMMYVDLDELSTVFNRHWLWSTTRPNLAWFRRADFLNGQSDSLADSVRELVRSEYGVFPTGPVRMLTHFRYFGLSINPISLYYCFNSENEIEFVIAEVTNTPWREKHAYVLDARNRESSLISIRTHKELHVSPFLEMNYDYQFRIGQPCDHLSVQIENHRVPGANESPESIPESATRSNLRPPDNGSPDFDATLMMERRPLTSANLARVLVRYPLMTSQVFALIHWQAFQIWCKKIKFQKHPGQASAIPQSPRFTHSAVPSFTSQRISVEKTSS